MNFIFSFEEVSNIYDMQSAKFAKCQAILRKKTF
jgi:hypothetical protein